jgi:hypothetical protein
MKVEFGFDLDQVAKGHYAPKAYHNFIGFEVSKPVLERAFTRTYSLDLSSVFFRVDLAIGSYRHAVSNVIPRTTKVAWHLKRHEDQHLTAVLTEGLSNVSQTVAATTIVADTRHSCQGGHKRFQRLGNASADPNPSGCKFGAEWASAFAS